MAGECGWVVLELEGSDEDIEQGLAWVTAKGVEVETVDSEL
ncbi:MAG: NIL domain-containing protein [Dehalococcoidia bacterium]|nr:NIL domain-containing protein [Dehalococcoidia bacterium]